MNKKRYIYVLVFFAAALLILKSIAMQRTTTVFDAETSHASEKFNSGKNLNAARQISTIEGVQEAAVLSRNGKVIAGVIIKNCEIGKEQLGKIENILKKTFGKNASIKIALNNEKAYDIIELSYYINSNISNRKLIRRFNYLNKTINV